MIKVMHVLNTGSYSGAENVVITMITTMRTWIEGVYCSLPGEIQEYLDENNIQYYPIKKLTAVRVRESIKCIQPDIIHAHDFTAGIICFLSGTNIPIISHIHNNSPWIKRVNLRSLAFGLSCIRYKKILTVSESIMDEYVFGRFFKSKTIVVGNPLNIKRIEKLAGDGEKEYDIAFLGRLSSAKNPHLFLDIMVELSRIMPEVSSVMIGDGELREEIQNRVSRENILNVELIGFKKNPYEYLNRAKILCMPSAWEGFGLAAVEAMALGLPVISSNVGGLQNIVSNEVGSICETKDDYVKSLYELLYNHEKLHYKSQNAKKRAEMIADPSTYAKKVMDIYNSIV